MMECSMTLYQTQSDTHTHQTSTAHAKLSIKPTHT